MKKLLLLVALFFTIQASAQIIKPDLTRSPNGPNTIVDWNVKFKTMIIPHGNTFSLAGGQDSTGAMRLRVAGDTSVAIYIKGFGWLPFANKRDVTSITTILARNNTWTGPNIFNNTVTIGNSSTISGLSWNIPPSGNATLGNLGIISDGGNDGYSRITFNILGSNPASLDYGNHGIHPNDGYLYIGGGSYGTYKRVGVQGDTTGLGIKQDTTHIKFRNNTGGRVSIQLGNLSAQQITNPASDIMITADIQLSDITGNVGGGLGLRTILGGYDDHIGAQLAASITNSHHSKITGGTHPSIWGGSYHVITAGDYGGVIAGTADTLDNSDSFIGGSLNSHAYGVQNSILSSQNAILKGSNSFTAASQNSFAIQSRNVMLATNGAQIILGTYNLMGPSLNSVINSTSGRSFILSGTTNKIITGSFSGIGTGTNNYVASSNSFISTGLSDTIKAGGTYNTIVNGTLNKVSSPTNGFIGSGNTNIAKGNYHFIGNGQSNLTDTLFTQSTIVNGNNNKVQSTYGAVLNGLRAIVQGSWATVANGVDNHALGVYDFIWGGTTNTSNSTGFHFTGGNGNTNKAIRGTILNGTSNLIDTLSDESTIANGSNNTTKGQRSFIAGYQATSNSYGEIVLGIYPTNYTASSTTGVSATDRALTIGAGTSTTRFNAFTLLKNGKVGLGGIDNPNAWLELPANSLTVPSMLFTPGSVDYNGTVAGTFWNNAGVLKWYDGTAIRTVANLDGVQSFTNKTISGASNTITNVSLTTGVTGVLPVSNGGTGQSTYTNGQILIGNTTGNTLTKATLTAGNGIGIANSTGSITLTADTTTAGTGIVSKNRLATNLTGYGKLASSNTWSVLQNFLNIQATGFLSSANIATFINTAATGSGIQIQAGNTTTTAIQIFNYLGASTANIYGDGHAEFGGTVRLKAYTVATLPAGTVGMLAYVTDATAPTYNGTLTGGGPVTTLAFYDGTAWKSH